MARRLKINYISNLSLEDVSGGMSGMNFAAYQGLKEIADIHYVGPINPPINLRDKVCSKGRRMLGVPGDFFFFSRERLERIAREVGQRCDPTADFDFYHGFTPWILCQTPRPYSAWSDCTFLDYIQIYHDAKAFSKEDTGRVCNGEISWLANAQAVLFSSEWGRQRAIQVYGLPEGKIRTIGIFGAFDPPDRDCWAGSSDFYFIATNYRQKNGALCRKAMDEVWRRFPEARLRIIGARPPANDLVPGRVTYEGFFTKSNPSDLVVFRRHLAEAFALVHPTDADTTAMILIEVAFFGCPAISVDDFALREVVSARNRSLLLSRPVTSEKLATTMLELLSNPDLYRASREAARAHAIPLLTPEAFQARLQQQILPLLQARA